MVALDLSRTMDAIDVQPSRLERGKQKIRDLVGLREGARTALVAYAGSAHLVLPLTEDRRILETYLEALASGLPVVAQDSPNARWLLEDQALFVQEDDAAGVAEALRAAAGRAGPEDRARRRGLIERRFTWQGIAAQYFDFLGDVHERVAREPRPRQAGAPQPGDIRG